MWCIRDCFYVGMMFVLMKLLSRRIRWFGNIVRKRSCIYV